MDEVHDALEELLKKKAAKQVRRPLQQIHLHPYLVNFSLAMRSSSAKSSGESV
jgi:hypothetical protein